MDFWIWVVLSFVLGALIVIGVSILGERLGTKVGGLIGSLPHLIIISFYSIGATQGLDAAVESTILVPATMGINAFFLLSYYLFACRSKLLAPFGAIGVWAVTAAVILFLHINDIIVSTVIYFAATVPAFLVLEMRPELKERRKKAMRYTPTMIGARGALAGSVIASALIITNYAGPLVGGMFAVFPALMMSTMLIYTFQHDAEYAGSMAKTMMIGVTSVVTYALACHFLFVPYGLEVGSILAFVVAVVTVLVAYPLVQRMR